MTAARRAVRGSAAKPKKERIWVELLVATIADPIMGVEREKYSLQSSLTDGESVQLQIPRGDTYFDIRLSPDAARQLASDLVAIAKASDEYIVRLEAKSGKRKAGAR
jgi:hypothetical protein